MRRDPKGYRVQTIRVDLDGVRSYAALLDRHADEARTARAALGERRLDDETFGEIGQSLRTPQAYLRAAGSLLAQLDRAVEAVAAAAESLRQTAERYQGTDDDGAIDLRRRVGGSDATG